MSRKAAEPVEVEVAPATATRVEISAGGHQVVIEAAASLRVVKKAALELFFATDSPNITRGTGAMGFQTEQTEPTDLHPPDLVLPSRYFEEE